MHPEALKIEVVFDPGYREGDYVACAGRQAAEPVCQCWVHGRWRLSNWGGHCFSASLQCTSHSPRTAIPTTIGTKRSRSSSASRGCCCCCAAAAGASRSAADAGLRLLLLPLLSSAGCSPALKAFSAKKTQAGRAGSLNEASRQEHVQELEQKCCRAPRASALRGRHCQPARPPPHCRPPLCDHLQPPSS